MDKYEEILKLKNYLDEKKPYSEITLKSLHEDLILRWIYNSNAIEGNTLTLTETKVVLEGITVGGKTITEHLEVIGHMEAISYVEDIVKRKEPLTEWQIKNIHSLILRDIEKSNAGIYRKNKVVISGATHSPPEPFLLKEQMEELIKWYVETELDPIRKAAKLHVDFVKIHPFVDGNGRTSRLLMNFELMKNGFMPVVIRVENRLDYYRALDKAHVEKDYSDFYDLIFKLEEEILNKSIELCSSDNSK